MSSIYYREAGDGQRMDDDYVIIYCVPPLSKCLNVRPDYIDAFWELEDNVAGGFGSM